MRRTSKWRINTRAKISLLVICNQNEYGKTDCRRKKKQQQQANQLLIQVELVSFLFFVHFCFIHKWKLFHVWHSIRDAHADAYRLNNIEHQQFQMIMRISIAGRLRASEGVVIGIFLFHSVEHLTGRNWLIGMHVSATCNPNGTHLFFQKANFNFFSVQLEEIPFTRCEQKKNKMLNHQLTVNKQNSQHPNVRKCAYILKMLFYALIRVKVTIFLGWKTRR